MATAKKKPSAAQIAARKLFAERARAGTLTKRKKNPATKTIKASVINPRRQNPIAKNDWKIHNITSEKEYFYKTENEALKDAKQYSKFDVVGNVYKNIAKRGAAKWVKEFWFDSTGVYPEGSHGQANTRLSNPIKTIKRTTRTKNVSFLVHRANDGKPSGFIASFAKMAEAKQYAESYAKAYMCSVLIETKYN
jgi:hypothetical protein